MRSATLHRLESLLQAQKLDRTLASPWRTDTGLPVVSTGEPALDAALGGGWRTGELSELVGQRSTGRTSVLIGTLAAAARRAPVALVDAVDRFDPRSAARAGLALEQMLWVRGPALTAELARPATLDSIIQRALRAFDLIIRGGGFAVVVLDVADLPGRSLRHLPAATWLRLARAVEGRPTACLLVAQEPVGRSARGVSVTLASRTRWTGESAQARQFLGFQPHVTVRASHIDRVPGAEASGVACWPSRQSARGAHG